MISIRYTSTLCRSFSAQFKTDYARMHTGEGLVASLRYKMMMNPVSYNLSYELFDFLLSRFDTFKQELPFLASPDNRDIYANLSLAHLSLLTYRLQIIDGEYVDGVMHYAQSIQYIRLCDMINTHFHASEFSKHIVEEYTNRYKMINSRLIPVMIKHSKDSRQSEDGGERQYDEEALDVIDTCIVNKKFRKSNKIVLDKIRLYFSAHHRYLYGLSNEHILYGCIDWGLFDGNLSIEK